MTAALSDTIVDTGAVVARVNFDPAAETLPYDPEVDVRKYVDYGKLLEQGLGPNGALVAAVDSLIVHVDEIRGEIDEFEADYVIVDTPGQMELFAYRQGGPLVIDALVGNDPALVIFLIDAVFMENPASIVSGLTLAGSVALRFQRPQINVVSKADLLLPEVRDELIPKLDEPGFLASLLDADPTIDGRLRVLYEALAEALEEAGFTAQLVPVSIDEPLTLKNLYGLIQRYLAAGDDYASL